ncbi:MAG: type II CRISPR RNA-guided endonuclease Cas9 [Flavobacteriaceae bacterium]
MSKKLGLFVDTTSVNWTVINRSTNELIDMGVRVFPAGCENFGGGKREVSKKHGRRMVRLRRIRYARIRARKFYLLRLLIQHQMCPMKMDALKEWKKTKRFPKGAIKEWLALNPYELRERGLHEKLSLEEFGRIFYQISCHRGYRFGERNLKLTESVLSKGNPGEQKIGYLQTQDEIGEGTLGEFLYSIYPTPHQSYKKQPFRIRNRICTLGMYFKEIHQLWRTQAQFYYTLTDELRHELIGDPNDVDPQGALFYQRPLKSQKHRVGNCLFEPKKTRCCVSSLLYHEVEAWKWVNSIKYNNAPLKNEEARKVVQFYRTHYRFTFEDVKTLLHLNFSDNFNYKSEDQFRGSFINAELSREKYFGEAWFSFDQKKREDIFHALYFFNSSQRLQVCAQEKFGLSAAAAKQFAKISIDKSYAPISKMACKKILYFLQQGYSYKIAVFLAGIRNALQAYWEDLNKREKEEVIQVALNLHRDCTQIELIPKLKEMFSEMLHLDDFDPNKLYGFSSILTQKPKVKKIPVNHAMDEKIIHLKNATLVQSSFELRKVINALIDKYGPFNEIACELSVDLKVNRMQRFIFRLDRKRISENNKRYIEKLKPLGVDLIPMHVLRYGLWEECKHTCPYTGKDIPLELLFTPTIQIVYIHPWSRSLNDNSLNKTLCYSTIAEQLNERTPFEYFDEVNPAVWEEVKTRAAKLFSSTHFHPASYKKFKRFIKKYNYRDVVRKQFNDPHQLSRSLGELLSIVTPKVQMIPGNITQHLVDEFLLMSIFPNHKCENDYRLNALKAYVNAYCTEDHVLYLAQRNKYKRNTNKAKIPVPDDHYLSHIKEKVYAILVSHKKTSKAISKRSFWFKNNSNKVNVKAVSVRGMLHKDSLYGKRKPPMMEESMHIRRPLKSLRVFSQVDKIVDPVIRALVWQKVEDVKRQKNVIPTGLFHEEGSDGFPISTIHLPNFKGGDNVPVVKVRMRESFSNSIQLKEKENRYAIPRNNHHIMISIDGEGNYAEEVVTFWEVIQRYRRQQPIYRSLAPGEGEVLTHMHINDMYLMGIENVVENLPLIPKDVLRKHLYRVQKLSSKYYEFRLADKYINPSFEYPEYIRINNFGSKKTGWLTHNPVKVKISLTGDITLMNV